MKLHQLIPKGPSKSSFSPFQIILAVVRTRKEGILSRFVPSPTPLFFMLKICQCLFIWLLNISAGNKTLKPSVGFFRLVPKIAHIYIYQWRYISIGKDVHLSTSTVRKLTVCKGKVCLHASAAVHVTTTCSFACQRFRIPNQTIHWAERPQSSSDTFIGLHPPH